MQVLMADFWFWAEMWQEEVIALSMCEAIK